MRVGVGVDPILPSLHSSALFLFLSRTIDKSLKYDEGSDLVYEERKDMRQNLDDGMRKRSVVTSH